MRPVTANRDSWDGSQKFELEYWKNHWPHRHESLKTLQKSRHGVGVWFLESMGFERAGDGSFPGFRGRALEVGCGPIGFFELFEGVQVDAVDSLMAAYAAEIPYATWGTRGAATYSSMSLFDVEEPYDFVICSNVLDHTADWMEFLEGLHHAAKPDGGEVLIFTDVRGVPAVGHTQVFTPDQVRRGLTWLGVKAIRSSASQRATIIAMAACISAASDSRPA